MKKKYTNAFDIPQEKTYCVNIILLVLSSIKYKMIIFLIISNPGAVIKAKSTIQSVYLVYHYT